MLRSKLQVLLGYRLVGCSAYARVPWLYGGQHFYPKTDCPPLAVREMIEESKPGTLPVLSLDDLEGAFEPSPLDGKVYEQPLRSNAQVDSMRFYRSGQMSIIVPLLRLATKSSFTVNEDSGEVLAGLADRSFSEELLKRLYRIGTGPRWTDRFLRVLRETYGGELSQDPEILVGLSQDDYLMSLANKKAKDE